MTQADYEGLLNYLNRPERASVDVPTLLRGDKGEQGLLFMDWGNLERTLRDVDRLQRVVVALTAAEQVAGYSPRAHETVELTTRYVHGRVPREELEAYVRSRTNGAEDHAGVCAELSARAAVDCALWGEREYNASGDVEYAVRAVQSAAMAEDSSWDDRRYGALAAGRFNHRLWTRCRERLAFTDVLTAELQ